MDKGRFLIETHLRTGQSIGALAKAHGVHRSWLYKRLARYRAEGDAGLELRSTRPKTSPTRIADRWEEEIVRLRKELSDLGVDAGAATIQIHLADAHDHVPSVPTIWRVLKARGFVTPQPHKRPKSSFHRFEAHFPNECWQADMTHVVVANDQVFEVLNIIDDHSRLCVASRAFVTVTSPDVDENHGNSPRSITEIPHPLSDEVDDKVHHNEVGPFKAGGAYANQPEGTHSPCSHREKTWKHTHSTNGDGRSPPSPDTSVGIARRSGPTSTGQGSRASELAQPLIPSSPIATT